MTNLKIFCVSNIASKDLELLEITLAGVGKNKFPNNYIICDKGLNIQSKEKYYSELTFHYWFWKNMLNEFDKNTWIGFCQKRRFWLKDNSDKISNIYDLKKNILREIPEKWESYDAFLCNPINVSPAKTMKLIKRGWRNWIKEPSIIFNPKKHNIRLQFDMFHGYGILEKAINILHKDQREEFTNFVNNEVKFNPHIMVISKKKVLNKWFSDLFDWLFECEKIFGFKDLKGYDKGRLYAYLSERYLSFWFNKFYKTKNCNWTFYNINS